MATLHCEVAGVPLKVTFVTHAYLFGLYALLPFAGAMYGVSNVFFLLMLAWVLIDARSPLGPELAFIWTTLSMSLDIIALSLHGNAGIQLPESQFALAMAILNVLLKFYTLALLWFTHSERGGQFGCGGDSVGVSHRHGYESLPEPQVSVSISGHSNSSSV